MNVVEKTEKEMKRIRDKRAADLETIRQKCEEIRTQVAAQESAMNQAAKEMDALNYEEAKDRKRKAEAALEMYDRRLNQIKRQELITESESDAVIDGLLDYEAQLTKKFKNEAGALLQQLNKVYSDYSGAVIDAEAVMTAWQNEIHANYRTFGRSFHTDPVTGQNVFRSDKPVAVHQMPYIGWSAALPGYLDKLAEMLKTGEAE